MSLPRPRQFQSCVSCISVRPHLEPRKINLHIITGVRPVPASRLPSPKHGRRRPRPPRGLRTHQHSIPQPRPVRRVTRAAPPPPNVAGLSSSQSVSRHMLFSIMRWPAHKDSPARVMCAIGFAAPSTPRRRDKERVQKKAR